MTDVQAPPPDRVAALPVPVLAPAALPDVVLLPSPVSAGPEGAEAQLRQIGELLVVPLYSSPESLTRCCGPDQPWFAVPSAGLAAMVREWGADLVLLDTCFQGAA